MTADRTRRTLGGLAALSVLAGAALVVLAPPSGAALSEPGVYGLVVLGGAGGLLAALATLAVLGARPEAGDPTDSGRPGPATTDGSGTPEPVADPDGADDDHGEGDATDGVDSVQELFEQVADEEPPRSLVEEDAAEGGFVFGGDRE